VVILPMVVFLNCIKTGIAGATMLVAYGPIRPCRPRSALY
jgi:hypothetical protein